MEEKKESEEKLLTCIQSIDTSTAMTAVAIKKVSESLEMLNASSNTQSDALVSKLDELMEKIGTIAMKTTPKVSIITDEQLESISRKQAETEQQIRFTRTLAAYYKELIKRTPPYSPQKFRTFVSHGTPEFEKQIRSSDTIHRVNEEVILMRQRIKKWEDELGAIQTKRDKYMTELDTTRAERFKKITQELSEKYEREWMKKLEGLKMEYDQDMASDATPVSYTHLTLPTKRIV